MYSWSTVRAGRGRPGGGAQGRGGASAEVSGCRGGGALGMGELDWMVQDLPGVFEGPVQRVIPWGQQPTEFLEFCGQIDRLGSHWALQRPVAGNFAP